MSEQRLVNLSDVKLPESYSQRKKLKDMNNNISSMIINGSNGPSSVLQVDQADKGPKKKKKSLTKSMSNVAKRLLPPQNRKNSFSSESQDEEESVNKRRVLGKNKKMSNISVIHLQMLIHIKGLIPGDLRNIMDDGADENELYKKKMKPKKTEKNQIEYQMNSNVKKSEAKAITNTTKPRKDSDQLPKEHVPSPKVLKDQKEIKQRKSKVNQQGTLGSNSEKSQYIKQQMKNLVKNYLNRSQTQIDDTSPRHDFDKQNIESSKKKSNSKEDINIKKISYFKLDNNKTDPIIQDDSFSEEHKKAVQLKKFRFLLRVNGDTRIRWDLFVMILSIWNCYQLPFDVAFQPYIFQHLSFTLLNNFIDICFGIDILLNFRTTFLNRQTGDEISKSQLIAKEYLKSKFWIDMMATIPFDQIFLGILNSQVASKLQLFSMLKLLRVLRLSKIITYMNATDEIKLSLKLFKMLFFLIMYLHCQACAWFYIVSVDQRWTPPVYMIYDQKDFYQEDVSSQYWVSFYTSLLILYGGDQSPLGNYQFAFLSLAYITAAMINANILGTIAVIIQTMNRRASRFQEQIDIANTAMKNMKLPEELQRKVQEFMMYTQSNLDYQKQLDMFLNMISPSLRLQVTQHIFLNAISKNVIFKGNQELIRFVVHNIITLLYLPEDIIIRQDSKAHHLFFLAQGTCEVWVRDQYKRETFVRNLVQGVLFGEVGLIAQVKRTASVKSKNYCTLAALVEENFYDLCQQFPDVFFKMKQETKKYNDKWKTFQKKLISSIEYFNPLSDDTKEELYYKLSQEYFEKDTDIFNQGEQCEALYFIVDGEIDLIIQQKEDEEEELLLDTLYTGCSIGAYSLISQIKYPYSARARNDVTLLVLTRVDLYETIDVIEELNYALWDAQEFINNNGVPVCDYTIYRALWRTNKDNLTPIQKFKNAVRRIKVLNQRNKVKHIKFLDLLNKLRQNENKPVFNPKMKSTKKQSLTLRSNYLKSHLSLAPFISKNLIHKIKNKTADNGNQITYRNIQEPNSTRQYSYVNKLTLKIESLSDHIKKQNKQMITMQRLFNQKLNNIIDKRSSRDVSSYSSALRTDDDVGSDRIGSERSKRRRNSKGRVRVNLNSGGQNTSRENLSNQGTQKKPRDNLLMPVKNQSTNKYKQKFKIMNKQEDEARQKEKFKSLQLDSLRKNHSNMSIEQQKRSLNLHSDQEKNNEEIAQQQNHLQPTPTSNRQPTRQSSIKAQKRYEEVADPDLWEETGATNMNFNKEDSIDTSRKEEAKQKIIQNYAQMSKEKSMPISNQLSSAQSVRKQVEDLKEQSTLPSQNRDQITLKKNISVEPTLSHQNSAIRDAKRQEATQGSISKKLSENRIASRGQISTRDKPEYQTTRQRLHSDNNQKIYPGISEQNSNRQKPEPSLSSKNQTIYNQYSKNTAGINYLGSSKKLDEHRGLSNHSQRSQNSSKSRGSNAIHEQELVDEYVKEHGIQERIQSQISQALNHQKEEKSQRTQNELLEQQRHLYQQQQQQRQQQQMDELRKQQINYDQSRRTSESRANMQTSIKTPEKNKQSQQSIQNQSAQNTAQNRQPLQQKPLQNNNSAVEYSKKDSKPRRSEDLERISTFSLKLQQTIQDSTQDEKYSKNMAIDRMTTKEMDKLINEEVAMMAKKKRKKSLKKVNKQIEMMLEKHFREDVLNDSRELENIVEEDDSQSEYYYEET